MKALIASAALAMLTLLTGCGSMRMQSGGTESTGMESTSGGGMYGTGATQHGQPDYFRSWVN